MNTSSRHRDQGVALIIVLSFVVLVAAMVVAFLSRAQTARQISAASTGGVRADSIAQAALDVIVNDFKEEIKQGSETTRAGGYFQPQSSTTIYPQRTVATAAPANLLKVSSASPFFSGTNYQAAGPRRGTGSSVTPAANKRFISPLRWRKPELTTEDIPAPAWVYVTETGDIGYNREGTGAPFTDSDILILRANGTRPVVGRFAYAIYNVGGLLDINVAGNELDANVKSHKGRLHQADPSVIPGLDAAAEGLIAWRNPNFPLAVDETVEGSLFHPARNFIRIANPARDQVFLNRQDLIEYATEANAAEALPYLTVFSREKNAPAWHTTGGTGTFRPNLPLSAAAHMEQRFPLSRLRALNDTTSANVNAWFGLQWDAGQHLWIYGSRNDAFEGIKTLAEVAAETPVRQPNFFEILKSVIGASSLGQYPAANARIFTPAALSYTVTAAYTVDQKMRDAQIFHIGANIIDQYDANNLPTDIFVYMEGSGAFATDVHNPANRFIGVEDLPYLSRMAAVFQTTPTAVPTNLELRAWLQPEFANPHGRNLPQSITAPPDYPIEPTGRIRLRLIGDMAYYIEDASAGSPSTVPVPTYTATAGAFAYNTVSQNRGVLIREMSTFTPAAVSQWNIVPPEDNTTAMPAGGGGFFTTATFVTTAPSITSYNYSLQGATPTSSFILEYEAEVTSSGALIWKPYSIWQGMVAGTNSRATVAANSDGTLAPSISSTPPTTAGWVKTDLRTERSVSTVQSNMDTANPPALPVGHRVDRAFRSVGELGYAFRDSDGQNLRFGMVDSPDAALLEFFSVDDVDVMAGKISFDTLRPEALQAMLYGASSDLNGGSSPLTSGNAETYASAIVSYTLPEDTNLEGRGVLARIAATQTTPYNAFPAKDSPVRALGDVLNTRTWNLMIDVIAQAGRVPKDATGSVGARFVVEGERRYWIHVAIDRYTGQVVGDPVVEVVRE